ncbi:MAG TPA: NADPH-dependent FMN reductase [Sphingobacteriaceae bacterium]
MTTIIAATNRPDSYTIKLSESYKKMLDEHDHPAEILSLTDLPDNTLHNDMYSAPEPAFTVFQDRILASGKFIFIVPEYNGSFPGVLKVFIDACRYPDSFSGKKAALVGLSSGRYGNIRGIDHLSGICHYLNMHILPLRIHIPSIRKEFDEEGRLFREDTLKYTRQQVRQFVEF